MTGPGPIAAARARAAARAAARTEALAQDARRPTMEPGPGAGIINALALENYRRGAAARASRVDGTPAVWPSPNWSNRAHD